jgi:FlaA1/EpsC-like NDP-sugar epimerase
VRHRVGASILLNVLFAVVAYLTAFALRFDLVVPERYVSLALRTLPLLCICKLTGFWVFGLFTGWWRHVSVRDTEAILKANLAGSGLFLGTIVLSQGTVGFPRAVFLTDFLLCTALVAGTRIAVRLFREHGAMQAEAHRVDSVAVIVGAGSAGIRLMEELQIRKGGRTALVGFIDDDPEKQGMHICGMPVLGPIAGIPEIVAAHEVSEVLVAIPSAGSALIRRVTQLCGEAKVRSRILPSLGDLVDGRFIFTQMREVALEDLLGRVPVRISSPQTAALLSSRCVVVTGAAGSIGSELCRQVSRNGPERVVIFDRHENGIFLLESELRHKYPNVRIVPVLGDILLRDQLDRVFREQRPDIVFHAAAYKHVPLAEANVVEAVRNNILGTRNVVASAIAHDVGQFVLISTDKAVRPSSVMGVTKRIAEIIVREMGVDRGRYVTVRFGNVLGSNGSVVPLFREQISRGGPVTVTHPEVSRYFMTIPEAVALVLQAATVGRCGETLVLKMGQPVRITDLARQMIELSGFAPGEDIEIVFTGLRAGEKLHEELLDEGERMASTAIERISSLERLEVAGVSSDVFLPRFETLVSAGDVSGVLSLLQDVVPTFRASSGEANTRLKRGDAERSERSPLGARGAADLQGST